LAKKSLRKNRVESDLGGNIASTIFLHPGPTNAKKLLTATGSTGRSRPKQTNPLAPALARPTVKERAIYLKKDVEEGLSLLRLNTIAIPLV